jgi:AcrR family transcriptional regulator
MTEVAQRILEAAVAEFAQYGYDGARLARIAQAAGVHTSQIHYYFGSKKDLYQEVQKHLQPADTTSITEVLTQADRPLPERIQLFYERFGKFVENFQALSENVSAALLPPLLKSPQSLALPPWEETLTQAQRLGLIRNLPLPLLLAHQWTVAMIPLWFMPDKTQWPAYYQSEAPAHFWALAKNIP